LNARGETYELQKGDLGSALADYEASADLGNTWAQNLVGRWYLLGKGTAKDPEKAQLSVD